MQDMTAARDTPIASNSRDTVRSPFWLVVLAAALIVLGGGLIIRTVFSTNIAEAASSASPAEAAPNEWWGWPVLAPTRQLRQVGKYPKDIDAHPELYYIKNFPEGVIPNAHIAPLGVRVVTAEEAGVLGFEEGWVFLDVRKRRDLVEKGVIPGARLFEYKYEGAHYKHSNPLTRQVAKDLLRNARGVVVYCNGPTCPRSFDACVALVQSWGIDPQRIRWLRGGAPSWKRTLLLSVNPSSGEG